MVPLRSPALLAILMILALPIISCPDTTRRNRKSGAQTCDDESAPPHHLPRGSPFTKEQKDAVLEHLFEQEMEREDGEKAQYEIGTTMSHMERKDLRLPSPFHEELDALISDGNMASAVEKVDNHRLIVKEYAKAPRPPPMEPDPEAQRAAAKITYKGGARRRRRVLPRETEIDTKAEKAAADARIAAKRKQAENIKRKRQEREARERGDMGPGMSMLEFSPHSRRELEAAPEDRDSAEFGELVDGEAGEPPNAHPI